MKISRVMILLCFSAMVLFAGRVKYVVPGINRLNDLHDVDNTVPNDGEVLYYNSTTGTWTPDTLGYVDSAAVAIYADSARISTFADSTRISNFADSSRISNFSDSTRTANYADSSRIAGFADSTRAAAYADSARIASFADSARVSNYADSSRVAASSNTATTSDSSRIAATAYNLDSALVINSLSTSQIILKDGSGFPDLSMWTYSGIDGYTGAELSYNSTYKGINWIRQNDTLPAFCNYYNAVSGSYELWIEEPDGDTIVTWTTADFSFDTLGIIYCNGAEFDGLSANYGDTILVVDGSGNVGWTLKDSLGGGTTLLSYAENGTFAPSVTGANSVTIGDRSTNAGDSSFVMGISCSIAATSDLSVCIGRNNNIGGYSGNSIISGGFLNSISGTSGSFNASTSVIAGGGANTIDRCPGGVISGGGTNTIGNGSSFSTICGGERNSITSKYCVISGGYDNTISGNSLQYSAIAGGYDNTISGAYSAIGGGSSSAIVSDFTFVFGRDVDPHNTDYQFVVGDTTYPYYVRINTLETDVPTVALEVNGGLIIDSLSVDGSAFADTTFDVFPTIKIHRTDTFNVASANTWEAIQFTDTIPNETINGGWYAWPVGSDSTKVLIEKSGLYQFGGCVHFQNNTGGNQDSLLVLSRITRNGNEARCSQREYYENGFKDLSATVLPYTGTVFCDAGDTISLEIYCSNTATDFISRPEFENVVAATLWLIWITGK